MGWILIPLAIAGIAGLSGGNDDCGYDACAVQSCAPVAQYAPAAPSYGYGQQGYAASGSYGGQSAYGVQQQQVGYAGQGAYGGPQGSYGAAQSGYAQGSYDQSSYDQSSYGAQGTYNGADFSTGASSY